MGIRLSFQLSSSQTEKLNIKVTGEARGPMKSGRLLSSTPRRVGGSYSTTDFTDNSDRLCRDYG